MEACNKHPSLGGEDRHQRGTHLVDFDGLRNLHLPSHQLLHQTRKHHEPQPHSQLCHPPRHRHQRAFAVVGLQEYFYDQVPDTMKSLGIAFYPSVSGAANFMNSLLITEGVHITERINGRSWFAKDLNKSRLDNFYWLLAVIGGINLCVYVILANRYNHKNVESRIADADSRESSKEAFILA